MNLSGPFIHRPIMTILVMLAILFFGIFAFTKLPVSDLPNIDYPTITVSASLPGGSPAYMASTVASPLEQNFASLTNLKSMSSSNTIGSTSIVLNFNINSLISSKEVEVQSAITATLPDLPPTPYNPTYSLTNPSSTPILFLSVHSATLPLGDLYKYAYDLLVQPLSLINGISAVSIYGYPYAVRVQADPMKLVTHNIDLNTLASTLVAANPNLAGGALQGTYYNTSIEPYGQLWHGAGYDEVIIQESNLTPLKVGDVAHSIDALNQRYPFFRYITKEIYENAVVLGVTRLPDSNTLEITQAIYKQLPELARLLPGSVELKVFYDKGASITASITEVEMTLIIALLLVVCVIFFYLGELFETMIPSLVLPMAIIATFMVMYLLGFNLDILSLLALTLAIGFMVDDAIVVMENIVRHIEMGKPVGHAALDGSKQISVTVLTMTIALSAVFIPMIWMPGMLGRIFHEFAVTLVAAILCSGVISLTLNPMLSSRLLKARTEEERKKKNFSTRMNEKLVAKYEHYLQKSIHHKKTMVTVGIASLVLSLFVLHILPTDFLPPSNLDLVEGIANLPEGSSNTNTIRHLEKANEVLVQYPHMEAFFSIAGPTNDQGAFYMKLPPASKRPTASTICTELRGKVGSIPGMNIFFRPAPLIDLQVGSTSSLGDFQYVLVSTDPNKLYKAARELTYEMQKIPEITGVNNDMKINSPQINFYIDRDRAGTYNVSATAIESTLQYAYTEGRISTFNYGNDLYDLIVEVAPGWDLTSRDLDLLYVKSPVTNALIPLTAVASWEVVPAPSIVTHSNNFTSVTISFSLLKGEALSTALTKINQTAKKILPREVTGSVQGSAQVFQETFTAMGYLVILSVVVIYLILGVLYESFIHPLTILSALPIACLGGLITLWLFGQPLSLFSVVGMIVLIGLVQKNGIMMIDFALEFLEKNHGTTPEQAIVEACKVRFRPIIMTTLAAMMGALPIAIGLGSNAAMNQPVGLVIVGGLIFSQLLTLFITPVTFLYMQSIEHYIRTRIFTKIHLTNNVD